MATQLIPRKVSVGMRLQIAFLFPKLPRKEEMLLMKRC
jgi:hypothetical protein